MAGAVDETIHEAGFGAGEVCQGQHRAGNGGGGDAAVPGEVGDGRKGVGFRHLIKGLEGKVGLGENEVTDVDGTLGGLAVPEGIGKRGNIGPEAWRRAGAGRRKCPG